MSTLAVNDAYARQVTQADNPNGTSTWTVAGNISIGPLATSTPLWQVYRALLAHPPAGYTGAPMGPDPAGFFALTAAADQALAPATRNALRTAYAALQATVEVGNVAAITAGWNDLIAQYSISAGDQATVHNYALSFGIPGI